MAKKQHTKEYEAYHRLITEQCLKLLGPEHGPDFADNTFYTEFAEGIDPAQVVKDQLNYYREVIAAADKIAAGEQQREEFQELPVEFSEEREQAEWEAEIEHDFSRGGGGDALIEEMKEDAKKRSIRWGRK